MRGIRGSSRSPWLSDARSDACQVRVLGTDRRRRDRVHAGGQRRRVRRARLRPARRRRTRERDMSTSVMGQQISLPVLISPTGVHSVHPDGEVAVARRSRPQHRDGPEFVRQQAHRGPCGAWPPRVRRGSRTCSTSCAPASTPPCSASVAPRCATFRRLIWRFREASERRLGVRDDLGLSAASL
ncbi:MAG: alpha-hydroxy-acid oxidizing protein [Solirubrobacterales bacterium]|nr:alpha-hydroxy-acid oxidizing protein [Solirubrobacterales bacterium]